MLFICISVMTCYLLSYFCVFCFFKQKTAYEMRISDWRSDVCSSDLLEHAAGRLTAIEINSTYYSSQKPESFAKWAAATPEGFIFTAKASRYSTNRRVLAEAGPSVEKFVTQGITRLGDRLGPILWQLDRKSVVEGKRGAGRVDL